MNYKDFLHAKTHSANEYGFNHVRLPEFLFDFQRDLVAWALKKGRCALFADCGLGKTPMQLVWADEVVKKTNGRVLILTPIAVGHQTIAEAEKFGIEAKRATDGKLHPGINVTNYERLHYFNREDFAGVVCDESSILKSFDGATKDAVTEFCRKMPYRLLATATAAPNDFIELGTSSEAIGELGYMDMLNRFFKNDANNSANGRMYGQVIKWRFKGHAELPFWQWVTSWARALRKPSDLGYADDNFILPALREVEHLVDVTTAPDGMLFNLPAIGLKEQRDERRRTIRERCEKASSLVAHKRPALVWCHLNDEGDMLERLIPDSVQISGKDSDDEKEEKFIGFVKGQIRVLVTKPKIGAWGLNLQHCNHITFFPSHSYEQYYQGVRRCWRFGQKKPVKVDIVTTEGEKNVMKNLKRKAVDADRMFTNLVAEMNNSQTIDRQTYYKEKEGVPSWL